MKKGFTLVELTGVVIILALISILVMPPIIEMISGKKQEISQAGEKLLFSAGQLYLSENIETYPSLPGRIYCMTVGDLINGKYLPDPLKDPISKEEISLNKYVKAQNNGGIFDYSLADECYESTNFADNSGANSPILLDKMIPIVYKDNKWIYADKYQKWYDYDEKEWANAIVLQDGINKKVGEEIKEYEIDLWYVWIPRYKYTLFNTD